MKDDVRKTISTIYTDPSVWKVSQPDDVRPNYLAYNRDARIGAVVVFRGEGQDYGLNQSALERELKAEKDGRIAEGYVSVWDQQDGQLKLIAVEKATVVHDRLRGAPLRKGKIEWGWGPYWWITAEFKPASSTRLSQEEPWR